MSGSLPSYYDGVVERTVYFADLRGRCYSRSTSVWVQNCGSFYVYYFKRYAMTCNYRFCGSDDYTSSILPSASATPAVTSSVSPTPLGVRRFQLNSLSCTTLLYLFKKLSQGIPTKALPFS